MELGHLSEVAREPGVTDIAVTCDGSVWVDGGDGMRLRRLHVPFDSAQSIRNFAVRLCSQLGRRLDDACPIADASTVDGVRVHAVIAPLVPQGAAISHRTPVGILGAPRHVSAGLAAIVTWIGTPQGDDAGHRRYWSR